MFVNYYMSDKIKKFQPFMVDGYSLKCLYTLCDTFSLALLEAAFGIKLKNKENRFFLHLVNYGGT